MNKAFLITRPNYDPLTNCLFYWSNFVIEEADRKNFKVLDLKNKKSNKKDFESYIKKHGPILVFFKKLMFLLTSEAFQEQRDVAPFLLANKK